jgi:hypothetical protein
VLTGLLTGRSSSYRKSQFPSCEEGETWVFGFKPFLTGL